MSLYDVKNRFMTQQIFFESSTPAMRDDYPPKWSLKLNDHEVDGIKYPSAYLIYMDAVDEYDAAVTLVGNMDNWEKLCSTNWFTKGRMNPAPSHIGLNAWREHKAAKEKSKAMAQLKSKAENGDTNAAKAILAELKSSKSTKTKKKESSNDISADVKNFLKRVK